jgi:hypothetical protein
MTDLKKLKFNKYHAISSIENFIKVVENILEEFRIMKSERGYITGWKFDLEMRNLEKALNLIDKDIIDKTLKDKQKRLI